MSDPLLMILSVVEGLYDGDPKRPETKPINLVEQWDDSLLNLASAARSSRGTGGMQSKFSAVRMATAVGENVVIANGKTGCARPDFGRRRNRDAVSGGRQNRAGLEAVDRLHGPAQGPIGLDEGACRAIAERGRSLLAIGITRVEGDFAKGNSCRSPMFPAGNWAAVSPIIRP